MKWKRFHLAFLRERHFDTTLCNWRGGNMTFIPIPNGISLCFDFTTAGQQWQFCLNLRKSAGAPTAQDLIDAAEGGHDWWTSYLKGFLDSTTTLRQVRATDMTAQGAAEYIDAVNEAATGGTNVPLPIGTAQCVSLRTDKRGRSYRGRVYMGGLTQGYRLDAANMTSAGISALLGHFVALSLWLDGIGYDTIVASRQHNGVITNPAEVNEVTSYTVDSKFDSQRRRLAGRGT